MFKIFISYRRSDEEYLGQLYDRLRVRFRDENVFMDVASLSPGEKFRTRIFRELERCNAVLCAIGPGWIAEIARLRDPKDFVRQELDAAFRRNIEVIPLLMKGITMPDLRDLPERIAALAENQAVDFGDLKYRVFNLGCDDLIRRLETLQQLEPAAPSDASGETVEVPMPASLAPAEVEEKWVAVPDPVSPAFVSVAPLWGHEPEESDTAALDAARKREAEAAAERQRLEQEAEAARQRALAEEAEQRRQVALEIARKRAAEEEAERLRLEQEAEAARQRAAAEEAERQRQIALEATRRRVAEEEAERLRVEQEAESARQRALAEEAERQRQIVLEAARQRAAEEEANRLRLEREAEAARQRAAAEEAARQRAAQEAVAARQRALAEEAERKRLAQERQRAFQHLVQQTAESAKRRPRQSKRNRPAARPKSTPKANGWLGLLNPFHRDRNAQWLRKLWPLVDEINRAEALLRHEPDDHLRDCTAGWKQHLARYDEEVEYFAEPNLLFSRASEIDSILADWERRLDRLRDDFPDSGKLADQIRDLPWDATLPAKASAVIAGQEFFDRMRDDFSQLRSAYLHQILPVAYAVVRNAARRLCGQTLIVGDHPVKWDMIHRDVQLLGGVALHQCCVTEIAAGEGKPLIATLPVYLNALTGMGVHVVTPNDSLARRDAEWMGELFRWLGLTVGCIQNSMDATTRREQYRCDITYGTASEFGFDYLRDGAMASSLREQVQRGHSFALIEEVDSVLIDQARTPLTITAPVASSAPQQFERFQPLVAQLVRNQQQLCDEFLNEAKLALQVSDLEACSQQLLRVHFGLPRHRELVRMMEEPGVRIALDKAEAALRQDTQNDGFVALREELCFTVDPKQHEVVLSERGRQFLNPDRPSSFLPADLTPAFSAIDGDDSLTAQQQEEEKRKLQTGQDEQAQTIQTVNQLLKAYCLYEKDVDYVVANDKVLILDEESGQILPGRRWSDGLHQAIEAKEGVPVEQETQSIATITVQNYFRNYQGITGMTGTAQNTTPEFADAYELEVLTVPTYRPVRRTDANDRIYKTAREKLNAIVSHVKHAHATGQPVIVGAATERSSEILSKLLEREGISHNLLTAHHHKHATEILARAGQQQSVTLITNVSGLGEIIELGPGVSELGGILVIGSERHACRRFDRKWQGLGACRGEPGASIFYLSFEDELMRQYGAADRMTKLMDRMKLEEGQELEGNLLSRTVSLAQKKVEERAFARWQFGCRYDAVLAGQMKQLFIYRDEVLRTECPRALVLDVIEEGIPARVHQYLGSEQEENLERDYEGLLNWANMTFPIRLSPQLADFPGKTHQEIIDVLTSRVKAAYQLKMEHEHPDHADELERMLLLLPIDDLGREHLQTMNNLRETIGSRPQGQQDPLAEYEREAYALFVDLMSSIKLEALNHLFRSTTNVEGFHAFLGRISSSKNDLADLFGASQPDASAAIAASQPPAETGPTHHLPVRRDMPIVGRNEPCPCGSGKKHKQCCGRGV